MSLLWLLSGAADATAFFQNHKAKAGEVRSYIVAASAWVYYRHWRHRDVWPWPLISLADARVPRAPRLEIANKLVTTLRCCLGPFADLVAQKVPHAEASLTDNWQYLLLAFARSVEIAISSLENKHARNQRILKHVSTTFANFAAKHVNAEAKHVMDSAVYLHKMVPSDPPLAASVEDEHAAENGDPG